jgi:hypothetical protein
MPRSSREDRQFAALRGVGVSSACLLAMLATGHRPITSSNVLILSVVISLLLAARPLEVSRARKAGIVGQRASRPVSQCPAQGVSTSAR